MEPTHEIFALGQMESGAVIDHRHAFKFYWKHCSYDEAFKYGYLANV
jgi:hypothetical protein